MTSIAVDAKRDILANPEEEYQSLLRVLQWTDKFGLLFVRCSPVRGKQLIKSVSEDLPYKNIEVLPLDKPIYNLYNIIADRIFCYNKQIDILFISRIEKSFIDYIKPGIGGEGDFYRKDSVPPVLSHLNLQRERFRDHFNICFVFILPLYGLKYFIHRAPDFFDWRSGVFEFAPEKINISVDINEEIKQKLEQKAKLYSKSSADIATKVTSLYLAYLEMKDD